MNKRLQEAISLYNKSEKSQALNILLDIVRQEPNNSVAWYGLALCLDDPEKKIYCLKRAVSLDPSNMKAQQSLEKLQTKDNLAYRKNNAHIQSSSGTEKTFTNRWLALFTLGLIGLVFIGVIIGIIISSIQPYQPSSTFGLTTSTPQALAAEPHFTHTPLPTFTPKLIIRTATIHPTSTRTNTTVPSFTFTVTNTPSITPTPSREELNSRYPEIDAALLYSRPNDYKGVRFRFSGTIVAMEQFENSNEWLVQVGPDMYVPPGQIVARYPVGVTGFYYDSNLTINMQITIYGVGNGYVTDTYGVQPIVIMEYYYYYW